ncbi:MAG TPA: cobalamin-independent methionine synthase II family protein [Bryobacteraceae bacterium]|jgi:5-methyltetrahydropteroyltriglutamate--homocysteine methyltransferase
MKRSENRILTTHVGSLVRPPELKSLSQSGKDRPESITATDGFIEALRRATTEVVKKQAEVGVDIISDGEFAKSSWSNYVLDRITGFEVRPDRLRRVEWLGRDLERFGDLIAREMPSVIGGRPAEVCVGPIEYSGRKAIRCAIDNFQAALKPVKVEEAFLTAVAPASTAYDGVNEYYPTDKDYVFAIAEALRQEYLEIHRAGLLLQVDDAVLANMYDHWVQQSPERYREWAQLRIDALNHALRDIPEDRVRYHVCFGSWHVPHIADAPLEEIVDFIVQVRAGAYSIEAANPRHEHEWRVWQNGRLPAGKILIPGVITHHTITVEHPRLIADRIIRYARLVGPQNVIAGTDCGFAQVDVIERVPAPVMWAKFEALVEGAALATKELF